MRSVRFLRFWRKQCFFKFFFSCKFDFILKTLMTVRCGVFATSCVRTVRGHTTAAVVRATSWSSTDTAEPISQVSLNLPVSHLTEVTCADYLFKLALWTVVLLCGSENHPGSLSENFCLCCCCSMFILLEPEPGSTGKCSSGFHLLTLLCLFYSASPYYGCNVLYSVYLQLESLLWYSLMAEIC